MLENCQIRSLSVEIPSLYSAESRWYSHLVHCWRRRLAAGSWRAGSGNLQRIIMSQHWSSIGCPTVWQSWLRKLGVRWTCWYLDWSQGTPGKKPSLLVLFQSPIECLWVQQDTAWTMGFIRLFQWFHWSVLKRRFRASWLSLHRWRNLAARRRRCQPYRLRSIECF